MCFEDELSDDDDDDEDNNRNNNGNTGRTRRPTKPDSLNLSDAQTPKTDQVSVTATSAASSLDVDGDSDDGGGLQRSGSSDVTGLLQCEDGVTRKPEPDGSESPFMPIRCPLDYKAGVVSCAGSVPSSLTITSMNCKSPDDAQLDSKRSPKLEHKAVTRVKSMMSIEAPNLQQQRSRVDEPAPSQPTQCGRPPRAAADSAPHCKRGDTSELVGVCAIDTVTLRRSEDESFGLDLEIMSSPLRVVITGLKAGGAAERVRLTACNQHWSTLSRGFSLRNVLIVILLCLIVFSGIFNQAVPWR